MTTGAVLTGHVDRLELFVALLEDVDRVHDLPGPAVRGRFEGEEVTVIGTGMGGPVTARAAVALLDRGHRVLVRAGGAGPVSDRVQPGDLVVASAAVRHEGTSAAYLGESHPAVAHPSLTRALVDAAAELGAPAAVGVVHSKDSFYGEVDPGASPQAARLRDLWQAWQRLGVLASEMEAAALFAVSTSRGARAGAVLRVNDVAVDAGSTSEEQVLLCRIALRATARVAGEVDHGVLG